MKLKIKDDGKGGALSVYTFWDQHGSTLHSTGTLQCYTLLWDGQNGGIFTKKAEIRERQRALWEKTNGEGTQGTDPPPPPPIFLALPRNVEIIWIRISGLGQTNEQQRHFNEWPISEFHGQVDSMQTSLKLLFPPAIMECCLCLSALVLFSEFAPQPKKHCNLKRGTIFSWAFFTNAEL